MLNALRKAFHTLFESKSQLFIKSKTTKIFLKQAETVSRIFLSIENLAHHVMIQRIYVALSRSWAREEPLGIFVQLALYSKKDCIGFFVQIVLMTLYINYDLLSFESLDALFNAFSTSPMDELLRYHNPTPSELEQLASGKSSLLTDSQLESFKERQEVYERRQRVLNSDSVRLDLIVLAGIIAMTGLVFATK